MNYITPLEQLKQEALSMQQELEVTMPDTPDGWVYRGACLCEYMARSGKCLADAKYHLAQKKKSFIINELTEQLRQVGYSATTQKELIGTACGDIERLVTWFDRMNRSCTHQLDYIRSLISKEKEEMRLNHTRQHVGNAAGY